MREIGVYKDIFGMRILTLPKFLRKSNKSLLPPLNCPFVLEIVPCYTLPVYIFLNIFPQFLQIEANVNEMCKVNP